MCRTVRIVAPTDGVLTVDVVSTYGTRPNLAVETSNEWRFENPASIPVAAGTEVMANIELAASSLDRQSYILTSAITPQP